MNLFTKRIAGKAFVAIVAISMVSTANAGILCDFENGASDYDNASPQTTGLFRDTYQNSYSNLSDNGAGNDYLVLSKYTSGDPICTAYDTTPGNGNPYTLFYTPVGETTTVTVDVAFHQWDVVPQGGLSIFDPLATGGGQEGVNLLFMDYTPDSQTQLPRNDRVRFRFISNERSTTAGDIVSATDLGSAQDDPILRFTISLTNNGTGASITTQFDNLDALGGNVTGNIWNDTQNLTYGVGTGLLNMDPANNGFEILLMRYVNVSSQDNDIYFDNLTVASTVVPEPCTLALLAAGLIGLLAYAWRKRK